MILVLFPKQFEKVEQAMFFFPDKETCKRAKKLVTVITRLLIGITFMQVLGGAYSSRKVR